MMILSPRSLAPLIHTNNSALVFLFLIYYYAGRGFYLSRIIGIIDEYIPDSVTVVITLYQKVLHVELPISSSMLSKSPV